MVLSALTGLATLILTGWWLYTVDWKIGTAFVTFVLTTFINVWNKLDQQRTQ